MMRAQGGDKPDFGPFEDDYKGYDLAEEDGSRGPLILGLAVTVVLIFAAVVWNTYRQGVRPDGDRLPIIAAEAGDYRRAPEDRGGAETPGMDRRIYDQMDGGVPIVAAAVRGSEAAGPEARDRFLDGGPPMELRPGLSDEPGPIIVEPAPPVQVVDPTPSEPERSADVEPSAAESVTRPEPAAIEAAEPALPIGRFAFDASGAFLVQIAALRSEAAAVRAWDDALAGAPDIFAGAERRIQRADLGARGVFYRLRAGAFATRANASEFCAAVKANGASCIVVQE